MSHFRGQVDHNLDDKGRLIMPLKHRDAFLPSGGFMAMGADGCLWLVPAGAWEDIVKKCETANHDDMWIDRMIYTAEPFQLDKQGRVTISPSFRAYAHLTESGPALVFGVRDRVELWDPETMRSSMQNDSKERASTFRKLGI